ncbi:MAG: Smr/MutS family protein [Pseudolabrys sp.]|nr:Smr/MutS family protein [Pseudolabrys sp.]MDP2297536.1 Smr/MutS family protein [Pseudolabrys sp.]
MSRDGKRRRGLTYEDRVLWTTVAKSIKPLRVAAKSVADDIGDAVREAPKAPKPLPPGKQPPKFKKPVPAPRTIAPAAIAKPAAPAMEPLTRRMKQRVAKGKHTIDARLDLHGFTQHEAHSVLLRFLRTAHDRDARLVLVITGKGRGGEIGVLRRQVPHWLGLPEFRDYVIGFEDAHVAHGGEGALYVRVRRGRGD